MSKQESGVHENLRIGQILELLVSVAAITHLLFFVHDTWKYPHEVQVFLGLCVFLVVLVAFNPASFARRATRRLVHVFEPDPFIAWFLQRDSALPDMQAVWRTQPYLGFIGLSHRSLATYLGNELSSRRALPWESIDVFFASERVGAMYEGAEFAANVRHNRQLIAAELTAPGNSDQLERLAQIRFQQMAGVGTEYSGSVFGPSCENPEVFYVVLSSPVPSGETKKALTFRVDRDGTEKWNPAHRAVLEHYQFGFRRILMHSHSLGTFRPSMWDQSASDWSNFCENSSLMHQEMKGLIQFTGKMAGKEVLDLGCGSGEMSQQLLRAGVSRLVALDRSPQMLRLAKHQLGDATNVQYALCNVPSRDHEDIDLDGKEFQTIFLHQVLPAIAQERSSLTLVARWCLTHLRPSGTVAIAAHDSCVELDGSAWQDPFRTQLAAIVAGIPRLANHLRTPVSKLRKGDIEGAFVDAGFHLEKFETRNFHNTMAERARMWSVPAILDTFVDVKKVGIDEARGLSHQAAELVMGQATKDRVAGYWLFVAP